MMVLYGSLSRLTNSSLTTFAGTMTANVSEVVRMGRHVYVCVFLCGCVIKDKHL